MTWTMAVRVQSEIYNNARIRVAGQQLPELRAFFFSEPEQENPCVDNPRVANPHRENPAQRNTHGIKYQSTNQT